MFDHVKSPQKRRLLRDMGRYEERRALKERRRANYDRRRSNDARACAAQSLLQLSENCNGSQYCEPYTGTASSTAMTMQDIEVLEGDNLNLRNENSLLLSKCEQLQMENQRLMDENTYLKERYKELNESRTVAENKLNTLNFTEASLRDDDDKVKYYTGLSSFAVLMALFNFLSVNLEIGNRSALSLFQQLRLVLMKLRLNVGDQDLAFTFSVNQSTISRCLSKWIDVMYVQLTPLVKWPGRGELLKTMLMGFRKSFKNCVTIIDCFEVFMERQTNLKARAQTWSNYKHHNTVKFLIAIAPCTRCNNLYF